MLVDFIYPVLDWPSVQTLPSWWGLYRFIFLHVISLFCLRFLCVHDFSWPSVHWFELLLNRVKIESNTVLAFIPFIVLLLIFFLSSKRIPFMFIINLVQRRVLWVILLMHLFTSYPVYLFHLQLRIFLCAFLFPRFYSDIFPESSIFPYQCFKFLFLVYM